MPTEFDPAVAGDFATALLLGALVGLEREKRFEKDGRDALGLRTFVLLAEVGAVGGYLSRVLATPWLLVAALLATAVAVAAAYVVQARTRPEAIGLTSEIAAIGVCLLGALVTLGHRELAVGLAVVTTAVLAYKQPLHGLVAKIGQDDVHAGLRLLVATFIVLPLLPDRAVDPWGAINPYSLWLLVLLISGLSLVGYVATRWLGPGRGIPVTAAAGGLVSSTAVTLTFVRQSREPGADDAALAGGILLAWGVMFGRVVVAATVVCPPLLGRLLVPFGLLAGTCAAAAVLLLRRGAGRAAETGVPLKNPFSLMAAARFALLFAAVQLVLEIVQQHWPGGGTYAVAALAGLTDVDAITLSMAEQARGNGALLELAVRAIAIAAVANTLVKCGMAVVLGTPGLRRRTAFATAALLATGGIGIAVA